MSLHGTGLWLIVVLAFLVGGLDGMALVGPPINAFAKSILLGVNLIGLGFLVLVSSKRSPFAIVGAVVLFVGIGIYSWPVFTTVL